MKVLEILLLIVIGLAALRYLVSYWIKPFTKKYRGDAPRRGLYRGKDAYGYWCLGYLQHSYAIFRKCVRLKGVGLLYWLDPVCDIFGKMLIQNGTLCEFTNFFDKKEKWIFESDILRLTCRESTATGIVRFGEYGDNHYGWYIEPIDGTDIPQQLLKWVNDSDKSCEVIGNIFDNPELLPGESDKGTADRKECQ